MTPGQSSGKENKNSKTYTLAKVKKKENYPNRAPSPAIPLSSSSFLCSSGSSSFAAAAA
jgi:hypothetical protein